MVKSELLVLLSERLSGTHIAQRELRMALGIILDGMTQTVQAGQRIEIRGFGSFDLNHHKSRVCRNPKSGEQVIAPEKHVLHFKAGKALRDVINKPAVLSVARKKSRRIDITPLF